MATDNRAPVDVSQTLGRGLKLLQLIAAGNEGVPVSKLAAAMQLPRSIVQRLLYTLEVERFIERCPDGPGYFLSIKLWSLGCAATRHLNLRNVARASLEDLARKTGETVKIGVLDRHEVVYLDGIEGAQSVRAFVPIGGRAPAHSSATGKAILAFLSPEKLAGFGPSLRRYTRQTLDGVALTRDLQQIRKRGYSVNRGEWDEQVGAVAAPVFDAHGDVVASVGVILPSNRLTSGKTVQIGTWTTRAAASMSERLGYRDLSLRPPKLTAAT
jgi:IclR family transcriptional regulator, KDG regulon repressor